MSNLYIRDVPNIILYNEKGDEICKIDSSLTHYKQQSNSIVITMVAVPEELLKNIYNEVSSIVVYQPAREDSGLNRIITQKFTVESCNPIDYIVDSSGEPTKIKLVLIIANK